MPKVTLYDYLAYNSDDSVARDARDVVQQFGYRFHGTDRASLAQGLKGFIREEGEDGLKALAMIHPDRQLILSTADSSMNMDGFGDGNDNGSAIAKPIVIAQPAAPAATNDQSHHTHLLTAGLIAVALILATAIICKK